jgi:hypothetical protein
MNMPPRSRSPWTRPAGDDARRNAQAGPNAEQAGLDVAVLLDADWAAVEERPLAFLRGKQFVDAWRVDQAEQRLRTAHQGHRDAPARHAMQERAGAVDRIDHPGVARSAFSQSEFLAQKTVVRECFGDAGAQQRFYLAVGHADDILPVGLGFDVERRKVVEIGQRQRAGFECCLASDFEAVGCGRFVHASIGQASPRGTICRLIGRANCISRATERDGLPIRTFDNGFMTMQTEAAAHPLASSRRA